MHDIWASTIRDVSLNDDPEIWNAQNYVSFQWIEQGDEPGDIRLQYFTKMLRRTETNLQSLFQLIVDYSTWIPWEADILYLTKFCSLRHYRLTWIYPILSKLWVNTDYNNTDQRRPGSKEDYRLFWPPPRDPDQNLFGIHLCFLPVWLHQPKNPRHALSCFQKTATDFISTQSFDEWTLRINGRNHIVSNN